VVAFVGRNGAGKSTITKLVNRLYDPTSGCILLDGHPLTEYDVESLRRGIGVAFQDFVQYETSVEENVNFGAVERLGDVANSDVALRRSGADFVERLPSGTSTRLGRWFEDAQQLSTGQWQRLAVARALAGRAGVILLDEPTAAVDAETESALFARLREVSGAPSASSSPTASRRCGSRTGSMSWMPGRSWRAARTTSSSASTGCTRRCSRSRRRDTPHDRQPGLTCGRGPP
jgi:ATP-binding cassette subfamily B protein